MYFRWWDKQNGKIFRFRNCCTLIGLSNRYIRKFGHMLRYSVYEIENSERILNNIITDINNRWLKEFDQTDRQRVCFQNEQLVSGGKIRIRAKWGHGTAHRNLALQTRVWICYTETSEGVIILKCDWFWQCLHRKCTQFLCTMPIQGDNNPL